jgi:hypothetical protein
MTTDQSFRPYAKLAKAVLRKALDDLGDKNERDKAYAFLTAKSAGHYRILKLWCQLANIEPQLIISQMKTLPAWRWPARIRELRREHDERLRKKRLDMLAYSAGTFLDELS